MQQVIGHAHGSLLCTAFCYNHALMMNSLLLCPMMHNAVVDSMYTLVGY